MGSRGSAAACRHAILPTVCRCLSFAEVKVENQSVPEQQDGYLFASCQCLPPESHAFPKGYPVCGGQRIINCCLEIAELSLHDTVARERESFHRGETIGIGPFRIDSSYFPARILLALSTMFGKRSAGTAGFPSFLNTINLAHLLLSP